MKPLRLLALVIAATAWCASAAFACDGAKTSAANASSCSAKSATAAAAHEGCSSKATAASTAGHEACSAKSATATTAAASADCCAKNARTTATAAAATPKAGACPATAACPMSSEQCKAMEASGACTAQMKAACAAKGAKTTAAAAGQCPMHATAAHADCAVCEDELECDGDIRATGARAQVVALRNGAMIVYTLDGAENVRALQAAVARHNQGVVAALQGDAKLCASCKKLRGALASGKLTREVVNVERGCQLLITSSDRSIVQQVHTCTNAQVAARTSTKI
jgi:hypothetical protein